MKFLIRVLLVFWTTQSLAVLDPSNLNAKIYAMYVSVSPYCTSPKLIFSNSLSTFYDVFGFPTLSVTDNKDHDYDGSYSCLIFKLSERITFRPNISGGETCLFTEQYTQDFCPLGVQTVGVDGTPISCSNSGDETVYLYLSTVSNTNNPALITQPFLPPTISDTSRGIKLDTVFTILGPTGGRLIIDGTSRITADGGSCSIGWPNISFVRE
jgi:hypothetical protein